MGVLVECSRTLDCYDESVMQKCRKVTKTDQECGLECDESTTTVTMTTETTETISTTTVTTTVTEVLPAYASSIVPKFAMLFAACALPILPMVACGCFPNRAAGCVEALKCCRPPSQKFQPLALQKSGSSAA